MLFMLLPQYLEADEILDGRTTIHWEFCCVVSLSALCYCLVSCPQFDPAVVPLSCAANQDRCSSEAWEFPPAPADRDKKSYSAERTHNIIYLIPEVVFSADSFEQHHFRIGVLLENTNGKSVK